MRVGDQMGAMRCDAEGAAHDQRRRRFYLVSAPPPDYPDYPDYPSLGYGPPAYPPAGYPGYPPPGYGRPANYPPPGYGSYPPSAYPPASGYAVPPRYSSAPPNRFGTLTPGIIPLRPLNVSDIFNGAAAYIRTNAKATLGLTAIVVVSYANHHVDRRRRTLGCCQPITNSPARRPDRG